jgi:hypothetical protein
MVQKHPVLHVLLINQLEARQVYSERPVAVVLIVFIPPEADDHILGDLWIGVLVGLFRDYRR